MRINFCPSKKDKIRSTANGGFDEDDDAGGFDKTDFTLLSSLIRQKSFRCKNKTLFVESFKTIFFDKSS